MTLKERFERHVYYSIDGCHYWIGSINQMGRPRFGVDGKNKHATRIAFELYNGFSTDGKYVCHNCDNPSCVNPDHLFLGTQHDNMRDMVKKGRAKSKLNYNQVLYIRSSLESGTSLAKKYNVSNATISMARSNKTWKINN